MKLLSWNVNGIRACLKKGFYKWFSEEAPDILCIQETKAFPEQLEGSIINPEGYFTYWNNPDKKGYAGVSVFSKKEPFSVLKDFGPTDFNTEGRALILEYKKFILINVYFPNGGRGEERLKYKLEFYDRFFEYLNTIKSKNVIVCGDVNTAHKKIDLARPKENEMYTGFLPVEREWIDKLLANGYIDTFRQYNNDPGNYTWWDYKTRSRERNVGWRIDYFFVNNKLGNKLEDAFILENVYGSDHCPIGIEIKV